MAQQTINVGTNPNDGTGDPLRTGFVKTNSNFTELYTNKQNTLVSGTNIKTINGETLLGSGDIETGSVTEVSALTLGTSGTDLTSTIVNGTTTPQITLNVPSASGTNRGVLTSADWTTFNSKQKALVYNPYRFIHNSNQSSSASLSESIYTMATINGNTFQTNDVMRLLFQALKATTIASVVLRIRINTSPTLLGATQIATYTMNTTNTFSMIQRNFNIRGGGIDGFGFTTSGLTDIVGGTFGNSTYSYNPANVVYIFFTYQLGNIADSVTLTMANLYN